MLPNASEMVEWFREHVFLILRQHQRQICRDPHPPVPRANNYSTPRLAEKQKTELSKPPDIPEDETVRVQERY